MRGISLLIVLLSLALLAGRVDAASGITDPTLVVTEPATPRPAVGILYTDPKFGTTIRRLTDHETLKTDEGGPVYSQLQAWNADHSAILLATNQIVSPATGAMLHEIDFGWPGYGLGARWSPTDPNILYFVGGIDAGVGPDGIACAANQARLMRYRLMPGNPMTGKPELVACFPEYVAFEKNASYEELSIDGRYIGLAGVKASGAADLFLYDLTTNTKRALVTVEGLPDWIAPSPLGTYLIVNWSSGGDARNSAVEAFDLEGAFVGIVATGHGHGDLAVDQDGVEWYVDWSPDNYVGVTGSAIKKNRLPDGYAKWKAGTDSSAIVEIVDPGWSSSLHISCQAPRLGWCVFSTYAEDTTQPWGPFTREVVRVYLDSTLAKPHIERLAHNRSDFNYVAETASCGISEYWAQPHATIRQDGRQIAFGSTWGKNCYVETYAIDLDEDGTHPPASSVDGGTAKDGATSVADASADGRSSDSHPAGGAEVAKPDPAPDAGAPDETSVKTKSSSGGCSYAAAGPASGRSNQWLFVALLVPGVLLVLKRRKPRRGGALAILIACLLGMCLLGAIEAQAASPADMPPNSWLAVPNTHMRDQVPAANLYPDIQLVEGPSAIIDDWSGAALDVKRSRLVVWGGGHSGYAGNELYAFDVGTLTWSRLTDPSPSFTDGKDPNPNGTPNSRHTYNGLAYLAHADRFFGLGGALAGFTSDCDYGAPILWLFDFDRLLWNQRIPTGDVPHTGCGDSASYDPTTARVFYGEKSGLYSFDERNNQWTQHSSDYFYSCTSTVDTRRRLLVYFCPGPNPSTPGSIFSYDIGSGNYVPKPWATSGGDAFVAGRFDGLDPSAPGLEYDPVRDRIIGWDGGPIFILDPETRAWSSYDPPGAPAPAPGGTFGRWRYVPSVDAFIAVTHVDENVHFYKPPGSGASVAPPIKGQDGGDARSENKDGGREDAPIDSRLATDSAKSPDSTESGARDSSSDAAESAPSAAPRTAPSAASGCSCEATPRGPSSGGPLVLASTCLLAMRWRRRRRFDATVR